MSKIIPFEVKETLKELRNKATKFVSIINDEKSLLTFQGNGDYNSFFFKVIDYESLNITGIEKPVMAYNIHYLPFSESETSALVNKQNAGGVNIAFETWLKLVSDHISIDDSQPLSFDDLQNNDIVEKTTATNKQEIIKKSKIESKVIWQYVAWIATISGFLLAFYRFLKGQ